MRFPDGQEKSVPRNRLLPLPTRPPRQCDWAMAIDSWVYSAWHPGPKQTSKVECYEVSYFFRDSSTASRWCHGDTVDGRNPAPVHRWFIPLFTGFFTSQVVQDFFHQQYHSGTLSLTSNSWVPMARGIDWHLQDLKGERERYNGFRCICGLAVPQEPRLQKFQEIEVWLWQEDLKSYMHLFLRFIDFACFTTYLGALTQNYALFSVCSKCLYF